MLLKAEEPPSLRRLLRSRLALPRGAPALHWLRYPIATDNDDRCQPCAIALLLPAGDEHMRACLQIVFATRHWLLGR
jgi:hypothetical protein